MRTRHSSTALLLLIVTASGAHASDSQNSLFDPTDAIQGFLTDKALLGAETATVGAMRTDGDSVTATDVAMTWKVGIDAPDGAVSITASATIPTLEVTGLKASGEGHAADAISMPSVNIAFSVEEDDEPFSYTMTLTDYTMETISWGKFPVITPDPAAPVSRFAPLADWMITQSYQKMSVGSVAAETVFDDDTQSLNYGPITGGPVVNGRLAEFSYGPFTANQTIDTPAGPQNMTMSYGDITGRGIDLLPMVQLLTGNGGLTAAAPIMAEATLASLKLESPELTVSMGPTQIKDFTIDPTRGAPLMKQLDQFVAMGLKGEEPDPGTVMKLILDMYGAYGFGLYSFSDIAFTAPGSSGKLGSFAVEGIDANGMKRFAITDGTVTTPDGSGALGAIEVRDVEFPDSEALQAMVVAGVANAGFDPSYLAAMPKVGGFSIRGLNVGAGFTGAAPMELGLFDISLSDFVSAIPTKIAVALEGLQVPAVLLDDPQATGILTALGADPLKADAKLDLVWEEATGGVTLDHDAAVGGVGTLKVSAAMEGIPRVVFENPMRANEAIATAAVGKVTIDFTDGGVTPFLMNMMAQQSGISAEQMAQGLAQQVQMQIGMLAGDTDLAATIGDAIRTFLSDPKDLELMLAPANPVPVAQLVGAAMAAPQQIPSLLNFSIKANR